MIHLTWSRAIVAVLVLGGAWALSLWRVWAAGKLSGIAEGVRVGYARGAAAEVEMRREDEARAERNRLATIRANRSDAQKRRHANRKAEQGGDK